MTNLETIFYQSKHSSDKWQPYFEIYERHLSRFAGTDVNLVEVGVQKGGSLDMWSNYFGEGSSITGIDVDEECSKLEYDKPNVSVVIGDQGNEHFWDKFLEDRSIDIFIDDGGHTMAQQIVTFMKVFPKLKVGGIYICEDTHTSYYSGYGGSLNNENTFIEYSKNFIDALHYDWKQQTSAMLEHCKSLVGDDLYSVHFYDSVVVFEKTGRRKMHCVFAK